MKNSVHSTTCALEYGQSIYMLLEILRFKKEKGPNKNKTINVFQIMMENRLEINYWREYSFIREKYYPFFSLQNDLPYSLMWHKKKAEDFSFRCTFARQQQARYISGTECSFLDIVNEWSDTKSCPEYKFYSKTMI